MTNQDKQKEEMHLKEQFNMAMGRHLYITDGYGKPIILGRDQTSEDLLSIFNYQIQTKLKEREEEMIKNLFNTMQTNHREYINGLPKYNNLEDLKYAETKGLACGYGIAFHDFERLIEQLLKGEVKE